MKSSKFAIISFVISFLIFVQSIIAFVDLPETHPLASILFPLVFLLYLPEYPLGYLPQYLGFPIILPALSIIFALISLRKGESRKILSIASIALVLISILLFLTLRVWPEQKPTSVSRITTTAQNSSPPQNEDLTSFFDKNKWVLVKSAEGDIDGDSITEKVILLKSTQQTGGGEFGDAPGPLYDADLLVLKGANIVYDFSPPDDSTRFLMSQKLEIRDVTGDSLQEIIFYSGTQRAANNWFDKAHILQYQNNTGKFVDISPDPFYDSLLHGFTIATFDGENFPIISDAVYNDPEHDCRMCVAYFRYQIYKWNGKSFGVHQVLNGQKLSGSWGDYLKSDLEYIHTNLKK